jgi:hypothetical protein
LFLALQILITSNIAMPHPIPLPIEIELGRIQAATRRFRSSLAEGRPEFIAAHLFSEVAAMTCAVDDLAVELETDPLRRRRPEARPHFASRVKTPYNESFGGRGNKERLSISFPAESEAHASVALAELVQL